MRLTHRPSPLALCLALCLALLGAPLAHAAAYAPASTAAVDWTPNATSGTGVPGGIPARTTIYTTITTTGDSTDRRGDIDTALQNCPEGQTVLLGPGTFYLSALACTYYTDSGNFYSGIGGKTLRGSGSSASTGTVIRLTGSQRISLVGGTYSGATDGGVITGSPVKGDTTLNYTSTSGDPTVGRLVALATENDETIPIVSPVGYANLKVQTALITAVNTGAGTFTIQPALYQTPVKRTGGAALRLSWGDQAGYPTLSGVGIEDMVIDNTYGSGAWNMSLTGAHGCWIKNVRFKGILNIGLMMSEAVQCEVRQCWFEASRDASWVTSNHAGISLGNVCATLFEDNVILPNFPLIETQNGPCAGNVFGYNFALQGANVVSLSNHGTGNHCNLWEGNSATNLTSDGYFGGSTDDVIYRNDLHGIVLGSGTPHFPIELCRFTRFFEIVGNQLGRSGTTLNFESSHPYAFNYFTSGTANNLTGDPQVDLLLTGTLTTRTSDSAGIITLDSTIGQLELEDVTLIGVAWGTRLETLRYNTSKGTVNAGALTVAVSGGGGSALPTVGTAVRLFTGSGGYRERDDATAYSTILLGNYYYSDGQIPSAQALGTTTLPNSLYRSSAPAFMSGYTWPPYDPTSPVTSYGQIPAGARYLAEANTVADPQFSPAAGPYASTQTVTITCATSGATIYYTTDGTTPTTSSSVYSSALSIAVSPSTTLKAFAVKTSMTDSSVTSGTYSFDGSGVTRINAGAVNATRIRAP